jgi:hypothetical protein
MGIFSMTTLMRMSYDISNFVSNWLVFDSNELTCKGLNASKIVHDWKGAVMQCQNNYNLSFLENEQVYMSNA